MNKVHNETELISFLREKRDEMKLKFNRHVSIQDLISDRWETASFYGFGDGSSCYNNVLIIGDVKVGKKTWIGPNVILDGSGGLEIGDYCSISAGVQIYTHDTINWSQTMGEASTSKSVFEARFKNFIPYFVVGKFAIFTVFLIYMMQG